MSGERGQDWEGRGELRDVEDVIESHAGRSRDVLDYSLVMKRLVGEAKQPGFSVESWAPLAEFVAIDEFERVGNFMEVMNWNEYVGFLTSWATTAQWECSFKRITETSDIVFLELEERSTFGEFSNVVNSLSVYEFDVAGRIRHLDIYLQMAMPETAMLESYEGIQISK
jgi:hypothetical protein